MILVDSDIEKFSEYVWLYSNEHGKWNVVTSVGFAENSTLFETYAEAKLFAEYFAELMAVNIAEHALGLR